MTRRSAIDLKYVGDEPTITSAATDLELIKAYNYYNYFYNTEDAKSFVIAFLKSRKVPKLTLKKAQQLVPSMLSFCPAAACRNCPELLHPSLGRRVRELLQARQGAQDNPVCLKTAWPQDTAGRY